VVDVDGAAGQIPPRLLDDLHRLPDLLDPDQVAAIAVEAVAGRDLEAVLVVAAVGRVLAQVPAHARAAQHRSAGAPGDGVLLAEDPDPLRAPLPDRVLGEKVLDL